MNVLSLYSGVGGLDIGLERAGYTTVGQVELNEFCRDVLAKRFRGVPIHDDVKTAPDWWAGEPRPTVHVLAGGPPCQGHSVAGRQLGTADERWGWPWFRAVLDRLAECQGVAPVVLIENVPNLVHTGLVEILEDLAERGFDAVWGRVPAAALGAPHLRRRLFLFAAHAERYQLRQQPGWGSGADGAGPAVTGFDGKVWQLAAVAPDAGRLDGRAGWPWRTVDAGPPGEALAQAGLAPEQALAHTAGRGREQGPGWGGQTPGRSDVGLGGERAAAAHTDEQGRQAGRGQAAGDAGDTAVGTGGRATQPGLGGGADGPAHWLDRSFALTGWADGTWEEDLPRTRFKAPQKEDRLRSIGNAVVPAVGEYVGRLLREVLV